MKTNGPGKEQSLNMMIQDVFANSCGRKGLAPASSGKLRFLQICILMDANWDGTDNPPKKQTGMVVAGN